MQAKDIRSSNTYIIFYVSISQRSHQQSNLYSTQQRPNKPDNFKSAYIHP